MNPVASKILLTKFNNAYEVNQITKIRLHSNRGSQVKCVRKPSRDVDIASVIRCGHDSLVDHECFDWRLTHDTSFGGWLKWLRQ